MQVGWWESHLVKLAMTVPEPETKNAVYPRASDATQMYTHKRVFGQVRVTVVNDCRHSCIPTVNMSTQVSRGGNAILI